ncbi:MAG: polysaccharide deacetylase family protein [Acidimicrobiales bacterium]|nr:polysaccharide deacetylase family protein [Acidimicrobiales bacterium]
MSRPAGDRPLASLSLDADNLWSYQKTHGDAGWDRYASYLDVLVPRVLEFLAERDLTITFFIVGKDASLPENREPLAALAAAGHEIGNHSFRHEPWLHLYERDELVDELRKAEEAIEDATGVRTIGFRGPGYSLSTTTLEILVERGYRYDASTLPMVIGPLARAYYFRTSKLTDEQKAERSELFGSWRDGLRSIRPYRWQVGAEALTELPVTTLPLGRVPIHVSYLLYLAGVRPALARAYFSNALRLCRMRKVEPSILLHPLDFLGADDVDELAFFPAMGMAGKAKTELVGQFVDQLRAQHRVVTMRSHVEDIERRGGLELVVPHFTTEPAGVG